MGNIRLKKDTMATKQSIDYKNMKKTVEDILGDITMLQALDTIVKKVDDSELSDDFITKMHPFAGVIASKLGITDTQAILLALAMNHCFDCYVNLTDIFRDSNCSTSRRLMLMGELDALVKRHLLTNRTKSRDAQYKIPQGVIEAFRNNTSYKPQGYGKMPLRQMFIVLDDLFDQHGDDELSYEQLVYEVGQLFDVNADSDFVRRIRNYGYDEDDTMLLLLFCHLFVTNGDDNINWSDLRFLYDSKRIRSATKAALLDGDHLLIEDKLVENANASGFADRDAFKLTEQAKRELLGELNIKSVKEGRRSSEVIRSKDIKAKPLFFPEAVERQVDELAGLLTERNYRRICRRMKQKKFHSGFACLFYGAPGTGKTETVYQLAKKTKRDVMLVDIPQVRSMWVGESEKNVKGIFDRYRQLVKDSKRCPILLFNEADAIISKRTHHDSSVDKMENTMQNIILQEMENLDGILIATTNLQENMDKAFERRFLYKIQYAKPDVRSREKIWNAMIPELDNSVVKELAGKYEFSGGQIENIARHYTIESILKGEDTITAQTLNAYCKQESIKKEGRQIGFK